MHFLRGVQADALADGTPATAALLQRLLAYPGIPALSQVPALEEPQPPVLAMHFRQGAISLHLFTTIATPGTPHDGTAQELRIEYFFPADAETAQVFHAWATTAAC